MAREVFEGKRPAFQFYPGDYLRDAGLRMCSLGARGLWSDMMCFMHQGEPYGHLTVKGRPIDLSSLSRMVGESPKVVSKLLDELEAADVFSRTESKVIYSRRMVKDEHLREVRAAAGKRGGNPALLDNQNAVGLVKQTDNQPVKQTPTPSSSSSSSSSSSLVGSGWHVPPVYDKPEIVAALDRFAEYYRQRFNQELFDAFMRQDTYEEAFREGWTAEQFLVNVSTSIKNGWKGIHAKREAPSRGSGGKQSVTDRLREAGL